MIKKLALMIIFAAAPQWFAATLGPSGLAKCERKGHAKCGAKCDKKCKVTIVAKDGSVRVADGRGETVFFGSPNEIEAHVVMAAAGHGAVKGQVKSAMVFVSSTDADEKPSVFVVHGDADADGNSFAWTSDDRDGADHAVQFKVLTQIHEQGADAPNRGWLGVSIKAVSDEMADQLDIEGRGILVLNVINDSPAELGGIEANDIIMAINGEAVTGKVVKVVELVSGHAPGEKIDVTVLRGGEEQTLSITLSSRADIKERSWKFDVAPFAEIEESVTAHGKMLRRDDEGNWVFRDLGDLTNLKELREHLHLNIPGGASHATQIFVDGLSKSVTLEIQTDEENLNIVQKNGGEITVTRTDEDGTESTTVYQDEDDLAEGDPDAFEHFSSHGKMIAIKLDLGGLKELVDFDLGADLKELKDGLFDWRADLHDQLSEAHEAYREAMEQAREAFEEAVAARSRGEDGDGAAPFAMPFFPLDNHAMFMGRGPHPIGQPKHSFSIDDDGVIEVRIRRGDSELVRRFENEADLETRNPKLYRKFEALMSADDE